MPATLSQIQTWSTEHLIDAATYWTQTADRWEDAFFTMRNQAQSVTWHGAGGDALRRRTGADLSVVSGKADQLRQAAKVARAGASDISAAQRSALYAVQDAQNAGFDVGEDLSVSYTDNGGTAAEQAARQAQAEQMASEIWSRAAQLEGADQKVAGQLTATAGNVGNATFKPAHNGNGIQLVDNTEQHDGPQPRPRLSPDHHPTRSAPCCCRPLTRHRCQTPRKNGSTTWSKRWPPGPRTTRSPSKHAGSHTKPCTSRATPPNGQRP
ncbi:hypothetical protein DE4576_04520 [Mycobacterium marinum]|nr:hypothetical protein DE4576_04520 [Mycobacterium marinum]